MIRRVYKFYGDKPTLKNSNQGLPVSDDKQINSSNIFKITI